MSIVPSGPFVAIDFETANESPVSACALALVRVEGDRITARWRSLIRPPTRAFTFTSIHGIAWEDVASAPSFAEVWAEVLEVFEGASFLAAHNAKFDRGVLEACCAHYRLILPRIRYVCTVDLARATWRLPRHRLPDVCRHLRIPLAHHDPMSDAEACARIVVAAGAVRRAI